MVGVPAVVDISVEGNLEHVTEGESVAVECVIIEEGVPPVTVRLHHEQHGGHIQELGDGAQVALEPTLSDTGSGEEIGNDSEIKRTNSLVFTCEWSQEGPGGDNMYEGKVPSAVTEVYLAPSFVEGDEDGADILLEEDGVEIRIVFRAKPWPQEEELSWFIEDADKNLTHVQNSTTKQGNFLVNDVKEVGDDEYTLESVLHASDLKEDTTIFLTIQNEVGSIERSFNIIVPTTTTTTTTTSTTTTEENITAIPLILPGAAEEHKYVVEDSSIAAIIAIVIGVLFGIALILMGFVCYNKKSETIPPFGEGSRSNRNSGYFPVDNGHKRKVGRIVVNVKLCGFDII